MDSQTIRTLEFQRVQEILKRYPQSPLGQSEIDAIQILDDPTQIQYLLNCVEEMGALIKDRGRPSLQGSSDIRPLLQEIRAEGSFLRPEDLIPVRDVIRTAQGLRKFVGRESEDFPLLRTLTQGIDPLLQLGEELERIVDDRGEIKDSASALLAKIRCRILEQKDRIKERLEATLLSEGVKTVIQERLVTIRNDRYVIPLKPDFSSKIQGIIHDQSSSGATVFVEPADTVEMNNHLSRLAMQEGEEIHRILLKISDSIREAAVPLQCNVEILASMDLHLAKALFAEEYSAGIPKILTERKIDFKKARHPLLWEKKQRDKRTKVVPIDLQLGENFRTLIITGPNTGGKTVALKTLGLLTLMAQAGIPIPVNEGSSMGIVRHVFADIGDEQSIQEDVSTFSSHIRNIVQILEKAGPESLVLLDELGTGTDPREGAALGMALLEELGRKGSMTAATTHYEEIKHYAYCESGMMNASVAFDTEKLCPGFVLEYGHLGTSHAFEISERIGLPREILERAKEKVSRLDRNTSELIQTLEEGIRKNRSFEEALQKREEEMKLLWDAKDEEKKELLDEAHQTIGKIQEEFIRTKKRARALLKAAEQGNRVRFEQEVRKIEDELPTEGLMPDPVPPKIDLHLFRPGLQVEISGTGRKGVIMSPPDKRERVQILCNGIRMEVPAKRLKELEHEPLPVSPKVTLETKHLSFDAVSQSINLIGLRTEEAKERTVKYLDHAHLGNLRHVQIIHGIGTGALQHAVEITLKSHPLVVDFRPGNHTEGGAGVTIVELAP